MKKLFESFKRITTRHRIYISVVILTVGFLILRNLDLASILKIEELNADFIKPIVLAGLTIIFTMWIGEFRIRGERIITILGFPAVNVFVFSLFIELIIRTLFGTTLGQFTFTMFSGIVFALFTYVVLLTTNVVNLAYLDDIPLGQAGRAAYYVINLIIGYLLFLLIITNDINIVFKLASMFVIPFYIVYSTLWTIKIRSGQRVTVSLLIAFLIAFVFFVLSIWPLASIYAAFILSIVLYITLGIALEIRERISRQVWIEYGLLFFFIFIIILLLSEWGINGTVI